MVDALSPLRTYEYYLPSAAYPVTHKHYPAVPLGQELQSVLAGWFWLRVWSGGQDVGQDCSHPNSRLGFPRWLTHMVLGRRSQFHSGIVGVSMSLQIASPRTRYTKRMPGRNHSVFYELHLEWLTIISTILY